MSGCQVVPEGLAEIPPGPRLAAVLSGIDLARLSGFDCVEVLKARYRQVNHERARLMAAMVEVGLCGIGPDDQPRRRAVPDEFSADEIRAALVLTRRSAEAQFWLAYDLITRLPRVHAALDAGLIDEPRARLLSEWTAELSLEQARALCDAVLARVDQLTTGQLIDQVKKLALALDPDWAQRRYERALAERKVVGCRNPDGSANLSGLNLPVERVAAACGHIDALAKAAKHAGDPRPLDHIRADLFLGMTEGTYTGLDDAAILERLRATHHPDEPDSAEPDSAEPDSAEPDSAEPDNDEADDAPECHDQPRDHDEPGAAGLENDAPDHGGPDDSDAPAQDGHGPAGEPAPRRPCGAGIELRVGLSTLLGRDEYPAELAGWGPLHAGLARAQATAMAQGQWRFALTDEHGGLLHSGITHARPLGWPTRTASCQQIVELQIPATTLHDLARGTTALGDWAPVITDLAHQHTTAQHATAGDPTRRFPGAALRRHVEIRDRSCIMIGCRAPARGTDTDHTLDHAHGGATTEPNLGAVCRHDHRLKHDGGWQLHQPEPGVFRWISRLGHVYHLRTPPIIEPLPDPIPRDRPTPPLLIRPDRDRAKSTIWNDTPPEADTKPPPGPPPAPELPDDPPPF